MAHFTAQMEQLDLAIVGAGFYGIQVAKVYIEVHPLYNVALLEGGASLGGTWSKERIYPGLKTNNVGGGLLEFPDLPMTGDAFGVKPGQHINGEAYNRYLNFYAEQNGVAKKIRLNTTVKTLEKDADGRGWILRWTSPTGSGAILAKKLVIATGQTNEPVLPRFPGHFDKPFLHTKDFARHPTLISDSHEIAVFGGGKSAFDAAYNSADAGVKVHLIIRESGHGPAWMSPSQVTPFKLFIESLSMRRIITWLSPCIWGKSDGYSWPRWLLHQTSLGKKIVRGFWNLVQNDVVESTGIKQHPSTARLMPWSDFFWQGTGAGVLNYDKDLYEFVRNGMIEVHVAEVEKLDKGGAVVLSTGETLRVDALLCATTWKNRPQVELLPPGLDVKLGLPHYSADPTCDGLFQDVDEEIFSTLRLLRDQPVSKHKPEKLLADPTDPFNPSKCNMPYLLYKFMVPPAFIQDRNIAFAGVPQCFAGGCMSTAQALWITAFFDGNIQVGDSKEALREAALHARYVRWRCPAAYGEQYPDWMFETLPWLDMILGQVGLKRYRKWGPADVFSPYMSSSFRGLVQEYCESYGMRDKMKG